MLKGIYPVFCNSMLTELFYIEAVCFHLFWLRLFILKEAFSLRIYLLIYVFQLERKLCYFLLENTVAEKDEDIEKDEHLAEEGM